MRLIALLLLVSSLFPLGGYAATYYVRNGGDDSADGRSDASAWATIDKVNNYSFSSGDSVLFHEGDTWMGSRLLVEWSGTSTAKAVVGAYYVDGGVERQGFKTSRPVIDGDDRVPGSYDGLIGVTGQHVRIQDLEIVNSEGRGVVFGDADNGAAVNLVINNTYRGGIKFIGSDNGLAEGNTVSETARAYREEGIDWDVALGAVESDGCVFRGNTVFNSYGEGINVNHGSEGSIIEGNFIFGVRAVGIYSDASPGTVIRRNMIVGTAKSAYWRSGDTVGSGIVLNNEKYHYAGYGGSLSTSVQSRSVEIYDNLVAYTHAGIGFWGGISETSFDDVLVYNNTLVDNTIQLDLGSRGKPGSRLANNILLSLSEGTSDVVTSDLHGMVATHNYFSQGNPGGDLADEGNVYEGLKLARMSGWRTFEAPDQVTWRDFVPQVESSTIGAGDDSVLQTALAEKLLLDLDFNGEPHNSPLDMGALRYAATPAETKVPRQPTGVTLTVGGQ